MLEVGDRVSYVDGDGVSRVGTIERFSRDGVATVSHPDGSDQIRINRLTYRP